MICIVLQKSVLKGPIFNILMFYHLCPIDGSSFSLQYDWIKESIISYITSPSSTVSQSLFSIFFFFINYLFLALSPSYPSLSLCDVINGLPVQHFKCI